MRSSLALWNIPIYRGGRGREKKYCAECGESALRRLDIFAEIWYDCLALLKIFQGVQIPGERDGVSVCAERCASPSQESSRMMSLRFAPGMRASVSRRASFALVAALALGFVSPRAASADAKSALPPAAGSFKLSKPPVVYNPATLENHIDGEAETVKSYDFKQCAYAEYAPGGKGNQLITADVFQFGGPLDAYGYYSVQRNAAAKVVKVGAEGYQEPSALNFWKGPYYVRLTITASNAPATFQATLPTLAQAIAAKLTGATATPSVVKLLPPGYPPRTDQFRRKNIAAQSYLVNGVSARYPSAGPQAELSISDESSPAVAKSAFGRYQTYLTGAAAAGAKAAPVKGLGEAAVAVRTKFSGNCIAALKGKYIVTIRKAKDPAAALKLAQSAVSKLK